MKDPKEVNVSQTDPLLVILNDNINDDIVKFISSSCGLLICRTNKNILSYPEIVQVAQCTVNGTSYSLLRKVSKFIYYFLHVNIYRNLLLC